MTSIRAICFDLFHTLVDVGSVPLDVGRYTADILGLDHATWNQACFSQAHDIRGPTRHVDVIRSIAHSLNDNIPETLIEQAADERQRRFEHSLLHVDDEVLDTLSALRDRGLKLALLSNASTAEVARWDESPMAGLFEPAVFSCACGHAKPEPGIYEAALDALGIPADQALFVGDGGSDEHRGARRVGMKPVLITRHLRHRYDETALAARRRHTDHEVHRLAELLPLLDSL